MDLIRIDDPEDPRIAGYRNIRERDLVGRQGLFISEGKVVLDVLLSAEAFQPRSLLILENRVAGLAETLAHVPDDVPVYVAAGPVLDAIAGFHMHRGILALGQRRAPLTAAELLASLPDRALVLVLSGISNHDNVGSIFRNAAAFGADAVFLDSECCDPLYRKSIRVSVGGVLKVPFARFDRDEEFLLALKEHGFRGLALSPHGAHDIRTLKRPDRAALFLGTEGEGLPPALLAAMDTIRIPIAAGFDSLNVAAASAIALHRLSEAVTSA
ncbi:RNA methyltransferase [Pseudaminobacter sp. 19-2017]|uniref:RNA methyltransferase n=1 Tax=Pseudaminobacter soli (ex Zhang et al. 2022) TaxID=2831468 RepID=A0A942E463_9HYPH|nr:RNA methyltransferase [Pseudaminobacter soli]MBS3650828.1 RNA methyltransferase [Pseudaminobacter soli]